MYLHSLFRATSPATLQKEMTKGKIQAVRKVCRTLRNPNYAYLMWYIYSVAARRVCHTSWSRSPTPLLFSSKSNELLKRIFAGKYYLDSKICKGGHNKRWYLKHHTCHWNLYEQGHSCSIRCKHYWLNKVNRLVVLLRLVKMSYFQSGTCCWLSRDSTYKGQLCTNYRAVPYFVRGRGGLYSIPEMEKSGRSWRLGD